MKKIIYVVSIIVFGIVTFLITIASVSAQSMQPTQTQPTEMQIVRIPVLYFEPSFISLDSYGRIWLADSTKDQIQEYITIFPNGKSSLKGFEEVSAVDVSSDTRYVAASTVNGKTGSMYLFDRHGNLLWSRNEDRSIFNLKFSPDDSHIVASAMQILQFDVPPYENQTNGVVYYFEKNGNLLWSYSTGKHPVAYADFSPDGSTIGVITSANIFYLDDNGKIIPNYNGPNIQLIPLTPAEINISQDGLYVARGLWTENGFTVLFYEKNGNLLWGYDGQIYSFTNWFPIIVVYVIGILLLVAIAVVLIFAIKKIRRRNK